MWYYYIGIIGLFLSRTIKELYLFLSIIIFLLTLYLLLKYNNNNIEYQFRLPIHFGYSISNFGIDGLNLSLIVLTSFIYPILFLITPTSSLLLLHLLFFSEVILYLLLTTLDLFFFYLLFEIILIPLFVLISNNGSLESNILTGYLFNKFRIEASKRFFYYSFFGSLFMLLAIIFLFLFSSSSSFELLTYFNYLKDESLFFFLWLSFFITFAIKLPLFPFHTWLPLAHSEANTQGSVILAAILLKIGTYGLIRFTLDFLPGIYSYFIPLIFLLATLSIYYSSFIILRQIDLKRIIAYSSIIHMNYSIFSMYSNNIIGLIGTGYLMISHGLISSGLFILIGILYLRYHSRYYFYYNNLMTFMPIFTTLFFLFILNNIAFPITSSFISEILIFSSLFNLNFFLALFIAFSIFLNTLYSIWIYSRIAYGLSYNPYLLKYKDINKIELFILLPLLFFTFLFGLFPLSLLNLLNISLIKYI